MYYFKGDRGRTSFFSAFTLNTHRSRYAPPQWFGHLLCSMKGNWGRKLTALGVKVVRTFSMVEFPALGLDSSVKFCILHCYI